RFYAQFEQETGAELDRALGGGIRIALTRERLAALRHEVAVARTVGVEAEEITPDELHRLVPSLRTDEVVGAVIVPFEGYVRQTRAAALGMAQAAQRQGVRVLSHTPVTAIERSSAR